MRRFLSDYLALLLSCVRTIATARWLQRFHRLKFLVLFLTVFPVMTSLGRVCMGLDHILYPGFRDVVIRKPVFIVGPWRTGSTFLHRTLALDSDQFVSFRMIDFFMPSIVQKRFMQWVVRLDERLGGHGARLLTQLDDGAFPGYSRIHRTGFLKVEEDEFLFLHVLASSTLHELFPDVERFKRFLYVDRDLEPALRRMVMAFYEGMIKRHLYHAGGDKRFLSKNPMFSPKIATLHQQFPDACFINLVRSPLQALPSSACLLHHIWHQSGAVHPHDQAMDLLLPQMEYFYEYPPEALARIDAQQYSDVLFDDLVGDPQRIVRELFDQFDLTLTPELDEVLAGRAALGRVHKSKHTYAATDWGLDARQVYLGMRPVFRRYGFAAPPPEVLGTRVA